MKIYAEVDERLCEVNVYRLSDPCDESYCGCGTWVGNFGYEVVGEDVIVHTWNFDEVYHRSALKTAANTFITRFVRPNNLKRVFVERSLADREWLGLGWQIVGKCEMLERGNTVCTT